MFILNEEDLRACAALMKIITGATPEECWRFADEFMEARKKKEEPEAGIASVKRTRKTK